MECIGLFLIVGLALVRLPANAQVIPQPIQFNVATSYKVGAGPVSVVAADFNGDGKMDLATANSGAGSVSILFGAGDGTFSSAVDYPVKASPSSLAVADFNADGNPDLVTANKSGNSISVVINKRDGTFGPPVLYQVGASPIGLSVGEIKDGRGAAIVLLSAAGITVVQDGGVGTGVTVSNYASGNYNTSIVLADFDGDTQSDIAVVGGYMGTRVFTFPNKGDGNFAFNAPTISNGRSLAVGPTVVGDLNGDGKLDLVIAGVNGVYILTGNGDATFTVLTNYTTVDTLRAIKAMSAGDLNKDGKLDLVVANISAGQFVTNESTITVLLGSGEGTFTRTSDYSVGKAANSIAVADFDNDGKLDLAVADSADNSVSVLLGNGNGTFGVPPNSTLRISSSILGPQKQIFASGDANGDGFPDMIVANGSAGTVSVMTNTGQGSFREASYFKSIPATSIVTSDFSGDGKLDLVIGSSSSNTVAVMLGNNDATFDTGKVYYLTNHPGFIIAGDLNGDGKKDSAIANSDTNTVSILLGTGDGSFTAVNDCVVGAGPISMVIGDFNNDNKSDLAVVSSSSATVSVLAGKGDGTFEAAISLSVSNYPISVVVGDLNRDGRLDLAVAHATFDGNVSIVLGNGDGTFEVTTNYVVGRFPRVLFVGDFNQDGRLDLITANQGDLTISVLPGNGDGTFSPSVNVNVGISSQSGVVGDFNSDGQADVAIVSPYTVSVLLNQTHASLRAAHVGNQVAVDWPAFISGFVLESSGGLFSTNNWNIVSDLFTVIDGQRVVTDSIRSGNKFYRLRHP